MKHSVLFVVFSYFCLSVLISFCLNVFLSFLLSVSVRLSSSLVYEIFPSSRNSKFILWCREIRHLSDLPTCWCVLASSLFFPWTSKTRWEFSLVNKNSIPDICHFFTQAKYLENEIYTEKAHKLRQNTQ